MDAVTLSRTVRDFLIKFDIQLDKDIAGVTTDGASVMKRFGTLFEATQQLCFVHAVHLAVMKVLYRFKEEVEVDDNYCDIIDDVDDDHYDNNDSFRVVFEESNVGVIKDAILKTTIDKVRKVVKLFKKSPTKNDTVLQPYIIKEHGKRLQLILDCKTRWNSLSDMLQRFIKLKDCVIKALLDLKSEIAFTDGEFALLGTINCILAPIKDSVEQLCKRSATLLNADWTFTFLLKSIDTHSKIGEEIYDELLSQILCRRTHISAVLQYLHCQNRTDLPKGFKSLSKKENHKQIKKVFAQWNLIPFQLEEEPSDDCEQGPLPFKENLALYNSQQAGKSIEICKSKEPAAIIAHELHTFDLTGQRGVYLNLIYNALLTITPSSVEAERSFSTAGRIKTKSRCRMSHLLLDDLMVLNRHFLNEN